MNIRKLKLLSNNNDIILTNESILETFILKYNLQLETPITNIKLNELTISDNYIKSCNDYICRCREIIDISFNDNRKCLINGFCEKCPLYFKNIRAITLLEKELKILKKQKDNI